MKTKMIIAGLSGFMMLPQNAYSQVSNPAISAVPMDDDTDALQTDLIGFIPVDQQQRITICLKSLESKIDKDETRQFRFMQDYFAPSDTKFIVSKFIVSKVAAVWLFSRQTATYAIGWSEAENNAIVYNKAVGEYALMPKKTSASLRTCLMPGFKT